MHARLERVLGAALLSLVSFGCGPTLFAVNAGAASGVVEEARAAGAPEHAPYEFYYAAEMVVKAREEAAEANYEDAIRFATTAEEYGIKARDLARRRMREMGR